MTLIDLGDFKIRFDPKEVRINIDGDLIDVGARREEVLPEIGDPLKQYVGNSCYDLEGNGYIWNYGTSKYDKVDALSRKKVKTL